MSTDGADFASSTAGSSTGSYLIPRTLLPQVMDAVRKRLVLRGLAARVFGPSSIPGRTLVIPMQSEFDGYKDFNVDQVAEGGEFPLTQTEFEDLTLTPVKYGARVGVSKEMGEDGIIDLIGYHAELAGYEFADNEEGLIVAQLDAAATASSNTVANSNATLPLTDITAAMQQLEEKNYMPTHMIVGVEVVNDLRNLDIFNDASKSGGPNALTQRLVGSIYGMQVIMSNNVSAKLAYIIDRDHAFVMAEKRPLTVERYTDYARDTSFLVVSQRLAVNYLRAEATSEITTT
jgi:HK97 family phage major capsid protein